MSGNFDDAGMTSTNDFNIIRKIGRGGFADVFLVERRTDKKPLVVKKVDMDIVADQGERVLQLAKQESLIKLRHPNIVNLFSSFLENNDLYLVMEYCPGGDLQVAIAARKEGDYFPESQLVLWCLQLTVTLKYLHDRHILHRDVATKNVFLMADKQIIKLGDFGIAKMISKTGGGGSTQIGTPGYASPEFCNGEPYTAKSEAWSLGVVIYNLAALIPPFHGKHVMTLFWAIAKSNPKPLPDCFSDDLRNFVSKLLEKNPEQRMSVAEAVSHGFLLPAITGLNAKLALNRPAMKQINYPMPMNSEDYTSKVQYGEMTKLHYAARRGSLPHFEDLVKKEYSIKAYSDARTHGRSPIHFAAAFGNLDIVSYLVLKDRSLANDRDIADGVLPIHIAAANGKLAVVRYFIEQVHIAIDAVDERYNRTPLHYACMNGCLEVVDWLVMMGSNVNARTNTSDNWSTPVHLAALHGRLSVVKFFIENIDSEMKVSKAANGLIPLHLAAIGGSVPLVSYFAKDLNIDVDTRDDEYGRTALHMSSSKGYLLVVKFLVRYGANVFAKSNDEDHQKAPIHIAALFGYLEVVRYFIEWDRSMIQLFTADGFTPMLIAVHSPKSPLYILHYFIEELKVDIETRNCISGESLLHLASGNGRLEIVKWLLDKTASMQARSKSNKTPLHLAAANGHLSLVKLFVESFSEHLTFNDFKESRELAENNASFGCGKVVEFFKSIS